MADPFLDSDADFAARLRGESRAGAGPGFVNGHKIRIKCTDRNPHRTVWQTQVVLADAPDVFWYFTNHQPDAAGHPRTIHVPELGGVADPDQAWRLIVGHLRKAVSPARANWIDIKFDEKDTSYPAWTRAETNRVKPRGHDDAVDSLRILFKKRRE